MNIANMYLLYYRKHCNLCICYAGIIKSYFSQFQTTKHNLLCFVV